MKMKIYDKEMYQKEQWIKSVLLVLGVFILGFVVGYFVFHFENQDEIATLQNQVNTLQYELNQAL
jgi:hypothetical protein